MPWLWFQDIERKDYGLLKTKRSDIGFRIFVAFLNVLATPFLLIAHYFVIFLYPCLRDTLTSCCCRFLFTSQGVGSFFQTFLFTDRDFPPDISSIGEMKLKQSIQWVRAQELTYQVPNKKSAAGKNPPQQVLKLNKLVENGINANDICQGQIGDCWLLSAIASLTTQPWLLENIFITREWNPRGKYDLRFYSIPTSSFVTVTVDDYIPVGADLRPVFTKPNGNEMWVMILEKAFAKFIGNYALIEGGHPLFALQTLTGGAVYKFSYDTSTGIWKRLEMKVELPRGKKPDIRFGLAATKKKLDSNEMYELLAHYHSQGVILAASSTGQDNTLTEGRGKEGGIVTGHAYTILEVYSPRFTLKTGIRLLKLRNPWGTFEWQGDWSDKSDLWTKHPNIRREMGHTISENASQNDDGVFFMSWDDFRKYFTGIDACIVPTNLGDIKLDVIEEYSVFGPCIGCLIGSIKYWLCCCGLYHLWCAKSTKTKVVALDV